MHNILKDAIKSVVEETAAAFFPPEFNIVPRVTVDIGDGEKYEATSADFTAIVGFNGDIEGGLNLAAPAHVTMKLAGALSGEEFLKVDDMVIDAFGELANMIAGSVKEKLSNDGLYEIGLTPPLVTEGNTHKYNAALNSTKQYFTVGSAPFFVEVFF
jgi:chemotaxis protein CheX